MKKVLSDYDGIWIDTEVAKAARWYFAAMLLRGDREVTWDLMEAVGRREWAARRTVERLVEERKEDIERAKGHAGGSRLDFAMRVWRDFLSDVKGEPTEERVRREMFPPAEKVRRVFIEWLSEPIWGNLRFFSKLRAEMARVHGEEHPFGLVTQTESEALSEQFRLRRADGSSFWGEFEGLLSVFRGYDPKEGFRYAECAGDYGKSSHPGGGKVRAYRTLCMKLGVGPEETITFEDTRDGVRAAKEAGVVCIGVRTPGSVQDLSEADLVVEGPLDGLAGATEFLVRCEPSEAVGEIERWLRTRPQTRR